MSGMNILSDIPKGGNNLEKASTSKGKNASDSPENVALVFTEMFSGLINSTLDPKGQNSKEDQASEAEQSTGNPMSGVQYLNLNLFCPMLQGDLSAGKEANSSLPSIAPIVLGNNFGLTLSNLASLISDEVISSPGMTMQKPQGVTPGNTELDKYKQDVANLLVALSGEISESSPKENRLNSGGLGPMDLRQGMAKIIQGWSTVMDNAPSTQVIDRFVSSESSQSSQSSESSEPEIARQQVGKIVEGSILSPQNKGSSESFLKPLKSNDIDTTAAKGKDTAVGTIVQQKSDGMQPTENKDLKIMQSPFREELQKGDNKQPTELSGVKEVQNMNTSLGIGLASNTFVTNVAEGKTIQLPVWEQISTVFREQFTNRHQELKELEIKLHPADLGKIQIAMRWENGQVHLQVQASEAATSQLLQSQLSELRQSLTSNGINCGMLQMGQSGERQQNPQGDGSQRTFEQTSDFIEDEELIEALPTHFQGSDEINRINVTA